MLAQKRRGRPPSNKKKEPEPVIAALDALGQGALFCNILAASRKHD